MVPRAIKTHKTFVKLVAKLSRNQLQKSILPNSVYIFLAKQMEDYRYVNIMIDATVLTMRVVPSTLSNPFSGFAPVPWRCTTKNGNDWTIAEYKTEVNTILAEIASTNAFIPVAVCHDRLRAQSTAIREAIKDLSRTGNVNG